MTTSFNMGSDCVILDKRSVIEVKVVEVDSLGAEIAEFSPEQHSAEVFH